MLEEELHLEGWIPSTETERSDVRVQLERMLASPLFRNSKRYPSLLRFLVEQALNGNEALLKERTLGVEVFHRAPDYDTTQDTIVRLTAGEVRKRIAQYYHRPEHAGELQIDLRPGSYVPVFRRADAQPANGKIAAELNGERAESLGEEDSLVPIDGSASKIAVKPALTGFQRRARWLGGAAALVALFTGALLWWNADKAAHSASRQLWAPILEEPGQVELVIADLSSSVSAAAERDRTEAAGLIQLLRMGEMVNYRDTL